MADLSPELASRIQALEASYADNPARYYLSLASAWRDAGDIARAEEILREGLKRFPGLSAHVLLGRCLADRGAFQEAANELHYVLSIDAQNLVALPLLAEMAAAGGRRGEAERWYNELLSVDPMNAEARSALAQLARGGDAPEAGAAPAAPQAAGAGSDDDEFGMIDLSAPDASPADASGVAADEPGEWGDLSLEEEEAAAQSTGEAGREFDAFGFGSVDLDAQAPAPAGWEDARQDVGENAAADAGTPPPLPSADDFSLDDAPLAGADLPLLDAEEDGAAGGGTEDEDLVSAVSRPGEGFGFGEPSTGTFDDAGSASDEAEGHDVDAEMVTETMAELYASQGLHAQAADVYRELIARRGEEPGLVRRLGEIEAGLAAGSAASPGAAEEDAPDWLESVEAFARGGGEQPLPDAGPQDGLPELDLAPGWESEPASAAAEGDYAAESGTAGAAAAAADPFADSFASGFDGEAEGEGEAGTADDGRQAWQAPAVAESEPVGFDILVVEDEDGAEVPASPEVVADVSADWAIAAAPLEEDERQAAAEAASMPEFAPAAAGRTMRGYFDALLSWQPGQPAAPTYEVSVEGGTIVIEPAAPADESPEPPSAGAAVPHAGPPLDLSLPEPSSPGSALPTAGALEPEGPRAGEDEPWGATPEDEPWAAAAPEGVVPQASPIPAAEALPRLELEEPWAEAPAAPPALPPADLGAFTLAEDETGAPAAAEPAAAAEPEEPLPWEVPAEPTAASEPAAAQDAGGGFSFEDFFSGAPSGPAPTEAVPSAPEAAAPEPAPEVERQPEPPAAPPYTPSFAEPAAPAPQAPAASAAEPQEGEDEDLESFQAWLQSLKR